MATKVARAAVHDSPDVRREDVRFQIDGVEIAYDADPEGKPILILRDVPLVEIRWDKVGEVLEEAGIPRNESEKYVDAFAGKVIQDMLVKMIASKFKRV